MIKKALRAVTHPWMIIAHPKMRPISRICSSRFYLKCVYRSACGQKLDLHDPVGFNAKLQWLKLHDKQKRYMDMVDKYTAKEYVGKIIGEEYIIQTYGVWNSFDEIDFDALPDRFVLKCTHDSAGLVICTDKVTFDRDAARKKITRCLKRNYFYAGREWPYKHLQPRVIAEAYMEDEALHELRDYKFFTFDGEPEVMHLVSNRQNKDEETYGDFFDMDFEHIDLTMGHNNAPIPPQKPINFDKMVAFARILAKDTAHLRVDFYEVDGRLYFGELTFFQDSGFADIQPPEWDRVLGDKIPLHH